jgi:hypothetical protein
MNARDSVVSRLGIKNGQISYLIEAITTQRTSAMMAIRRRDLLIGSVAASVAGRMRALGFIAYRLLANDGSPRPISRLSTARPPAWPCLPQA